MKDLIVFTNRGVSRLLDERGSQSWKLDPERVRKLTYIVCAQKSKTAIVTGRPI
jgi:hypothetical protein